MGRVSLAVLVVLPLVCLGCGRERPSDEPVAGPAGETGAFEERLSGRIRVDGSSTVAPFTTLAAEDDNVIVRGVSGERGGLGYFGFSYYEENPEELKALAIDGGAGCVRPSVETVQNGRYRPLSRPLYVYVKRRSFDRLEVETFVDFILTNHRQIARAALFVPLTGAQVRSARAGFEAAVTGLG
jgi:phosphate transport system substrate-binding protein